jgi:hypothetical protein
VCEHFDLNLHDDTGLLMTQYSESLLQLALSSDDCLIHNSQDDLIQLLDLADFFQGRYKEWCLLPPESFKESLAAVKGDSEGMNRLYWVDVATLITAYGVFTTWRASELATAVTTLMNAGNWLASGVVARALLELSANFIQSVGECEAAFESYLPAHGADFTFVRNLHERLDAAFMGTKNAEYKKTLGLPEPNKLCATLKEVSKRYEDCYSVYQWLCDFAHPNWLGTTYYWGDDLRSVNSRGEVLRSVGRDIENGIRQELKLKVLWTVGWGCQRTREAMQSINRIGERVRARFPQVASTRSS